MISTRGSSNVGALNWRGGAQNMQPCREPPIFTMVSQKKCEALDHWSYYIEAQGTNNTTPTFLKVQQSTTLMEVMLTTLRQHS